MLFTLHFLRIMFIVSIFIYKCTEYKNLKTIEKNSSCFLNEKRLQFINDRVEIFRTYRNVVGRIHLFFNK